MLDRLAWTSGSRRGKDGKGLWLLKLNERNSTRYDAKKSEDRRVKSEGFSGTDRRHCAWDCASGRGLCEFGRPRGFSGRTWDSRSRLIVFERNFSGREEYGQVSVAGRAPL